MKVRKNVYRYNKYVLWGEKGAYCYIDQTDGHEKG